jgi:putative ABC transport system permease protein
MPLMLGFNDITAKPLRSMMTGLNLTLGVIGIVFGLTLNRTLDTYRADPSLLGIVYDALVTREQFSDRKTQHLLDRAPGVDAVYTETLLDVETPQGEQFQIRAVAGELQTFPFRITKGRFFHTNRHEVIAGRGLLDWLGLDVGDSLTIIVDEQTHRPMSLTIVGEYPEPVNAGQMLMVDRSIIARLAPDSEPYRYYVQLTPDANPSQIKAFLSPDADSDLNVTLVRQAIPDAVVYLQLAIFALSAILIGIALINVFTTSLLAVQERVRTFGILKTVGMTPTQVILMVTGTSGALGLVATALGIPLGYVLTQTLMRTLSRMYGFGDVHVTLGLRMIVPLIPVMMLVSMLGGLLPGRHAAQLPIVKVLRHE